MSRFVLVFFVVLTVTVQVNVLSMVSGKMYICVQQ